MIKHTTRFTRCSNITYMNFVYFKKNCKKNILSIVFLLRFVVLYINVESFKLQDNEECTNFAPQLHRFGIRHSKRKLLLTKDFITKLVNL